MNRYNRQTILKDFGPKAQEKLANASVLVVGLGGLGIPVVQYLNAMGVGILGLVEADTIDISNLQRQVLYNEYDVGKSKLAVALEKLEAQNSETKFIPFDTFLNKDNALEIIKDFDVIVDASDNFATRYLINDACVLLKKPFVSGAVQGFEGQVSIFNFSGGPTYRCLFPNQPKASEIPNCNENGVLGVLPAIIGNLQTLEVVKAITGVGEVLSDKLLLYNGLTQSFQKIKFRLKPENLEINELADSYGNEQCEAHQFISAEAFYALESGNVIQIIDVRDKDEYELFHLPYSTHIPLNVLEENQFKINSTKPVYLICQSGKRSQLAQKQLAQQNITAINVEGGINSYLNLCT